MSHPYIVQALAHAWECGYAGKPYPGARNDTRAIEVYAEGRDARTWRPFMVCGKSSETEYSVRTVHGEAVATCAYNSDFAQREAWAHHIVAALNANPSARDKAHRGKPE